MTYTITLADGQTLTGLSKNGNNYVSETEIDTSIFDNNLSTMTVNDGEEEVTYENMAFIQQQKQLDGSYYICFRQFTAQEIRYNTLLSQIDYLAMMCDVDLEA